jgi:hypothetical protein
MTETSTTPWTMDYSGPKVMLTVSHKGTPIGDVEVTFTDAGHAHVSAYSDPEPVSYRKGHVAHRGGNWHLGVHVYGEHGWGERPGHGEYRHQFTDITTNRAIAPTYRAAIVTAITEAVSAFVAAHPEVLPAAGRNDLNHKLERALGTQAEARAALTVAETEVGRIQAELAMLDDGS